MGVSPRSFKTNSTCMATITLTLSDGTNKKWTEPDADKNTLWSVEVQFSEPSGEIGMYRLRNCTNPALAKFRADIFAIGLMYPVDPGHWKIIPPFQITAIRVYKQKKQFSDF